MLKKYGDIIPALFLIVVSGVYLIMSFQIKLTDDYGGAALIPKICGVSIILCSLLLIYQQLTKKKAAPPVQRPVQVDEEAVPEIPSNYKLVVQTLLAITLYAATFSVLGFILSTILYLFIQIMLLSPQRNKKAAITSAVTAVIVAFLVYFLFYYVFYIVLPDGSLWYNLGL